LAGAAGLWKLCEEAFSKLTTLQEGGLAHGDAELHNFIVCPTPLELILIDFEGSVSRDTQSKEAWEKRCALDLEPLLREAVYLQCALGKQQGKLAERSLERMALLLKQPEQFQRAIELRASVSG
jgi:predicted trehalose synthase